MELASKAFGTSQSDRSIGESLQRKGAERGEEAAARLGTRGNGNRERTGRKDPYRSDTSSDNGSAFLLQNPHALAPSLPPPATTPHVNSDPFLHPDPMWISTPLRQPCPALSALHWCGKAISRKRLRGEAERKTGATVKESPGIGGGVWGGEGFREAKKMRRGGPEKRGHFVSSFARARAS